MANIYILFISASSAKAELLWSCLSSLVNRIHPVNLKIHGHAVNPVIPVNSVNPANLGPNPGIDFYFIPEYNKNEIDNNYQFQMGCFRTMSVVNFFTLILIMKIKIFSEEMGAMLQWLGIILLAGLIIWWSFKKKKTGSRCSGCDACPLECAGRNSFTSEKKSDPYKTKPVNSDPCNFSLDCYTKLHL